MAHEKKAENYEEMVERVTKPDAGKLEQAVVIYMGEGLLDAGKNLVIKGSGACCGKCIMFLRDTSQCSILRPAKVEAKGVCGLFVGGDVSTSKQHEPMELVPQEVPGYIAEGPTRCGICKYFEQPESCRKVAGKIEENGCCNAYERGEAEA